MRLTANDISLTWLESATLDDLKSAMRVGGDVLNAVNALLVTPEGKTIASEMLNDPDYVPKSRRQVDPAEAAQIAEDEARAAAAAAEAEKNNQAANLGAPITPEGEAPVVEEPKKKIVLDYQVTDENGQPIGRPTHIEGWSWEEVSEKQKQAHIHAVRYAERLKANRSKQAVVAADAEVKNAAVRAAKDKTAQLLDEAAKEQDPEKRIEAIKKVAEAEVAAREAEVDAHQQGKKVAEAWMEDHKEDFLPCLASSNIMREYMSANGLSMSYENLEKAFQAVKHQLPKVERQQATEVTTSAEPGNNTPASASTPVPPAPASITPAVVPSKETVQPTVQPSAAPATPVVPPAAETAPNPTPAVAQNAQQTARRSGVNGSLQPGSMSAARPSEAPKPTIEQTRSVLLREIAKMPRDEYRKKLRDANYVKKLEAAGIPVVGQRG